MKVLNELNDPEQIAGSFTLISRLSFPFSYAVDVLPFTTTLQGRYVRLAIDSVHTFSPSDRFGYAIVGEVVMSAAPIDQPPTSPEVSVTLNPNGDVIVTFIGTLQSSPAIDGALADVPGNPQSTYTIPKGSLSAQQYFRARSN